MTDLPLVTVGIPTYNRPNGLRNTLQCITSQSYPHLEIIISDNYSIDPQVKEILQQYSAKDTRIQYFIQKENISIVPNFQFLLDKASGQYFMWAADDDTWDKDFIKTTVTAMEQNPEIVLCMTGLNFFYENQQRTPSKLNRGFMQNNICLRSFQFVKSHSDNKYFFCGLYRTNKIKDIPFNNNWGGDHLFIYEALTKGKFYYCANYVGFNYFRGGSSKGMESVRKAFNIKSRYYFFDAYLLRYTTYQFRFKHLSLATKIGLFFTNWLGLICSEEFILYYIFIKKPIKTLFKKIKRLLNR